MIKTLNWFIHCDSFNVNICMLHTMHFKILLYCHCVAGLVPDLNFLLQNIQFQDLSLTMPYQTTQNKKTAY